MENTYMPLIFSNRLKNLLMSIEDDISSHLLMLENNNDYTFPFSFIDISDDENSLTFLPLNKYNDIPKLKGYGDLIWTIKSRNAIRNGRFVNKIIPFYNQHSIEKWVNSFKAEYKNSLRNIKLNIVDGQELVKLYNGRYYSRGNGTLNKSCMRHDSCSEFMKIYDLNRDKIKMVVLMENDFVSGRAILWKLDEPDGRYLMDRIYVKEDSDAIIFIKYAESNGWLYKTNQSYDCVNVINNGKSEFIKMKIHLNSKYSYNYYPYIDTLLYYNVKDHYLTNDDNEYFNVPEIIKLRDINGKDHGNENYIYDIYNKKYLKANDATYCYYGDGYTSNDDAIYVEEYDEYALPDQVVFSKHHNKYILKKYSVFSKKMEDYLLKSECNLVYFDSDEKTSDYLLKSGLGYDHFMYNAGNFYYVDIIKKDKNTGKYELIYKKPKIISFRKKS